jgi:4-hydroxybenzoate polyprenyltransferase
LLIALIKTMRPAQWTKNGFIFVPLVFDEKLFQIGPLSRTIAGFVLLCLVSGTVYLINDLVDIEKDRQHPTKRLRPLPSGQLSRSLAIAATILIPAVVLPLGFVLDVAFGLILTGYLVLQIAYSFWLKNVVIIDVMVIAAGFVLRVAAGVVLVDAERFSPWLYVFTTLLALFMALGKRRQEIALLKRHPRSL